MELALSLRELWRLRAWVVLAFAVALLAAVLSIYRPTLSPPGLQSRTLQASSASTQILVDAGRSSLADTARDLAPLAVRADTFAKVMTSPSVVTSIATEAGIPPGAVTAVGPVSGPSGSSKAWGSPSARASQIPYEGIGYRLSFEAVEDQPVITTIAQAPTTAEAVRLANASVRGLRRYLERPQLTQGVPLPRRVAVQQLGRAQGGVTIPAGTGRSVAVLAFLGVFGALCVLILVLSGLRRSVLKARFAERTHGGSATSALSRNEREQDVVA
jgi:hypothetical protein